MKLKILLLEKYKSFKYKSVSSYLDRSNANQKNDDYDYKKGKGIYNDENKSNN